MLRASLIAATLLAGLSSTISMAQDPAAGRAEAEARFARWRAQLPPTTGPWPATRLVAPGLPTHTLYWPATRPRAKGKLPILSFGNGGCRNTSIEFAPFLAEIASRGYFVVAMGTDDVTFTFQMGAAPPSPSGKPTSRFEASALTEAVDWAVRENGRKDSPFFGRLDTKAIAYVGQSCGGIQALSASDDPRTATTVVLNSGYFATPPQLPGAAANNPRPSMAPPKPWTSFHAPIAFFTGGPSDMAFANAEKNFVDGANVPMFKAALPVGHTGAYPGPDQKWIRAVTAWLDWRLKGDTKAKSFLLGADCPLCKEGWSNVASHGLK